MSSVFLDKLPRGLLQEEDQNSSITKKSRRAWSTGGKKHFGSLKTNGFETAHLQKQETLSAATHRHVDQTVPELFLSYWWVFQQWELQRHGLVSPLLSRCVVGEPLGEVPQGLIQFPQPSLQ
jgi:hypothetical protein